MINPLEQQIRDIIMDETGMNADELTAGTALLTSGLVDSFTFVTVLTLIETEHGVKIPLDDLTLANFDTIQSILSLVGKHAGGSSY